MTRLKTTLLAVAVAALAAPAMAGGISFDLPRLIFPTPKPVVSSQSCTAPTTLNAPACATK